MCQHFGFPPEKTLVSTQKQSNFNGSNIFGTMGIRSRHGHFKPLRLIMAPGQEENEDNLGMAFGYPVK